MNSFVLSEKPTVQLFPTGIAVWLQSFLGLFLCVDKYMSKLNKVVYVKIEL